MNHKIRIIAAGLLLGVSMLSSSLPSMAQTTPDQITQVTTISGDTFNLNDPNAPIPEQNAESSMTTDPEFQARAALLQSLTNNQRDSISAIFDQHKAEIDAISNRVLEANAATANKVFLPLVTTSTSSTAASQPTDSVTSPVKQNINTTLALAEAEISSVQTKINAQVLNLLSEEQQKMYEQAGFLDVPETVGASSSNGVNEVQAASDCYYGAYYSGKAFYWAWYAEYYAYYDYIYRNTGYDYNDWYYNYYAKKYATNGVLYAGGAYALKLGGSNPASWKNKAYSEMGNARTNSYWGRYYAYNSWQKGSSYAYYAYIYANNAYTNEGYARTYLSACS